MGDASEGIRTITAMAAQPSDSGGSLDRERPLLLVPQPLIQCGSRIIGRSLAQKGLRNSVTYNVLKGAWASYGAVTMKEVDSQTMEFIFQSSRGKDQVMDISPWSINGHCLVLKECLATSSLQDVNFELLDTWIQIYGLSFDMFNSTSAQNIAGLVGRFRCVESDQVLQQRSFLRVKVELDTTKLVRDDFW